MGQREGGGRGGGEQVSEGGVERGRGNRVGRERERGRERVSMSEGRKGGRE